MTTLVWLNGEIIGADQARISPLDRGFTIGDGVFETIKVTQGETFAMTRHLARLDRSIQALGLPEVDHDLLRSASREVIAANRIGSGRLRITVTAGPGPLGPFRSDTEPTVLIAASEIAPADHGARVITVDWTRNPNGALVGIKATSYAENLMALTKAAAAGAVEAIFANTSGNLCEGAMSNIFVGIDGQLVTPPLSAGPLPGVTRELLIEILDVTEADLPLAALATADEVFITGSTRGVQGVAAIDGTALKACPGPLTLAAAQALAELERRATDP